MSNIDNTDNMNTDKKKRYLQEVAEKVFSKSSPVVEATLEKGEFYIYTNVWKLSKEDLDSIGSKAQIIGVFVEGESIALNVKL